MIHLFHRYRFAAYKRMADGHVRVLYTCACGKKRVVTRPGTWHPIEHS